MTAAAASGNAPLDAHVRLIRAAADLVEQVRHPRPGPPSGAGEIVIQVPEAIGDTPPAARAVARLADLTGASPAPDPGPAGPRAGSTPPA